MEPRRQTDALTGRPGDVASPTWAERAGFIRVDDSEVAARPFQPVRIDGTYRGGVDARLQVQRWEEGRWLTFPIPTTTDDAGRFTAYVELGGESRYLLRVLNPDSGVTSKPFELLIRG